jgi:hypothetical protein
MSPGMFDGLDTALKVIAAVILAVGVLIGWLVF